MQLELGCSSWCKRSQPKERHCEDDCHGARGRGSTKVNYERACMASTEVVADLTGDIETRIDEGESLEELEQEILDRQDLDNETKHGLALYAWAWKESRPRTNGGKSRRRVVITAVEA